MTTTTKTYNEYYEEAMLHYGAGEFSTVYDLLTAEEAHYPNQAPEVLYLRSCMAARVGDNALSMSIIREALDRGIWYGEGIMRRTPSWQPLQGLPEFEQLVASNKECEIASYQGPVLLVGEPEGTAAEKPYPLLLTLHGNGATGRASLEGWQPVVEQGWLLAAAQSSQAGMAGAYIWDDQEIALREIKEHYSTLRDGHSIDPSRVVLAGFSMGGETALRAALQGTVPARGFILLGPGGPTIDTPDAWLALMRGARERGLRGYVFLGENDNTVPHSEIHTIVASLNEHGIPCRLEIVPGIAHEYPHPFGPMINRALKFISDEGTNA